MAFHPFRSFQRNQKVWMAGATLLAIISFLFLGVIIQLIDGGRSGGGSQISTIAESRRFGKFTVIDLERFRNNQGVLERFLSVLHTKIDQKLALDGLNGEERDQALAPLKGYVYQIAQTQNPEYLVNMWLVTHFMREEGVVPDWDDVANLLKGLTGDSLTDTIYDESRQAVSLSHAQVEQLLAQQIQWQQALIRLDLSVSAVSPATRWDWFQRLNRQVAIEAAAVPIDTLIDQVAEPTKRQLDAFFEQHKGKKYNPMIAESGFIMPTELAFQYVVAAPTQQLLDSITEEEMLAFYEEHKDELYRQPSPTSNLSQPSGIMPMIPGGGFSFPTPGRPGPAQPILPDLPNIEDLPQEPAPGESTPDESTPAEPVNSEESAEETSAMPKVLMRLVSYQTDETDQAGETTANETTEPIDKEVPQPIMIPVTPRIIIQGEEEELEMPRGDVPQATELEAAEESKPVDLSVLYKPFDEVKEQIRAALAQDKAAAVFPLIQERMKEYAKTYNEHFEQSRPIPPMPDLTGFVAEQGLKLVTVPMGNVFAAMQTELARGLQEQQHLVQMFRRPPLLFDGNFFWGSNGLVLYWVTEEKQELRPKNLEEVREIVLKRWKEVEARSLALKKAEELANEAKASAKSLAEVFAGRSDVPVVGTEPFSWKTYGGLHPITAVVQRVPPMIGEVRESGVAAGNAEFDNQLIVAPGSEFMEVVYSLQVGETGVVFNQPQSVVYLVRVTSSSPSADVLWERFQSAYVMEYLYAGRPEMMASSFEAWLDAVREKTGFRWVNRPDARELGREEDF